MAVYEEAESYAASRAGGIGGTDCAAILGMSPWKRPIDIYAGKVDPASQPELDKECLTWGMLLEPVVRQRYAAKFKCTVMAPNSLAEFFPKSRPWNDSTLVIGSEDWMLGAPDGWLPGHNAGLEVKCSARRGGEWGTEGSDEIPSHYLIQVAWYMMVTGAQFWNFAVLFSGNKLEQFQVKRDPDLERDLIAAAREFWFEFVQKRVEPPIDESESYGRYLARKFSLSTGAVIKNPSAELIDAASNLYHSQRAVKAAEEEAQLRKNQIASMLADADAAITPFGKVAWVRPVPRQTIDWDGVAAACGIAQSVIDAHIIERPVGGYVRGYWKK